jgi:hypothetical protein
MTFMMRQESKMQVMPSMRLDSNIEPSNRKPMYREKVLLMPTSI